MLAFSLSRSSSAHSLSFLNNNSLTLKIKSHIPQFFYRTSRFSHHFLTLSNHQQYQKKEKLPLSAFLAFNPLRDSVNGKGEVNGNVNVMMKKKRYHGLNAVCSAAPLTTTNLQ